MARRAWFAWYPGDYMRDTAHLSALEDCFYRRLIDHYMAKGEALAPDRLYAIARAHSQDEKNAVDRVALEFLVPMVDGLHIPRCDVELQRLEKFSQNQRDRINKRWEKVRAASHDTAVLPRYTGVIPTTTTTTTTGDRLSPEQPPQTTVDLPVKGVPGGAPAGARGTALPKDWRLPKPWGEWALQEFPHLTQAAIREMANEFADHWHANSNRREGKKADWFAAWRNWVRRDARRPARNRPPVESRNEGAASDWLRRHASGPEEGAIDGTATERPA